MPTEKDNLLETFKAICDKVADSNCPDRLGKSKTLKTFFKDGITGKGFKGDIRLWIDMLLPWVNQRVYNLKTQGLITIFSQIFGTRADEMKDDFQQQGDISETIRKSFASSRKVIPKTESTLSLQEVDEILEDLSTSGVRDHQINVFTDLCKKATADDLKMVIRFITGDLQIGAKERTVLDAFGPEAYGAYKASSNLNAIVDQFYFKKSTVSSEKMTPIKPMLAGPCHSVDEAFRKCPGGLFSEIKYDGERVQIHMQGSDFKFLSRQLKPVSKHKISELERIIPQAFTTASDMVLDAEILVVDSDTGELLPFGTLGRVKSKEHKNGKMCLFIFDCIHFNGRDLRDTSLRQRRKILEANVKPVQSFIQLSESHFLKTKSELAVMLKKVFHNGLEGVVLKDPNGGYQPGKRGWMKVKKDYLFEGKMVDTADLVVLGAWFGEKKNAGQLSVYLMCCFDEKCKIWRTVTKVHGFDNATQDKVSSELMKKMVPIKNARDIPVWLDCHSTLIPHYIAKTPDNMPVFEITGAEFTSNTNSKHTANGISIRFPRVKLIRDDKTPAQATNLHELEDMVAAPIGTELLNQLIDKKDQNLEIETRLTTSPTKKMKLGEDDSSPSDDIASATPTPPKRKRVKGSNSPSASFWKPDDSEMKEEKPASATVLKKKRVEGNIFRGFIAHFEISCPINLCKCIEDFERWGGEVARSGQKANIVLYENSDLVQAIDRSRSLYNRHCRHLDIKWMSDSISDSKAKPFPVYAIELKN